MLNVIIEYLSKNIIEILGFIFGITYVLLAIKQSFWCWIAGIINVSMYIIVFYQERLYGDAVLQIFYLVMSFYGLLLWTGIVSASAKNDHNNKIPIRKTDQKTQKYLLFFVFVVAIMSGYLLSKTDNDIPYLDGLTTALGLAATWMTARKLLENWLVWIFTNILCVAIYAYKGLYPTMIFYLLLAIIAYSGYNEWKKEFNKTEI